MRQVFVMCMFNALVQRWWLQWIWFYNIFICATYI